MMDLETITAKPTRRVALGRLGLTGLGMITGVGCGWRTSSEPSPERAGRPKSVPPPIESNPEPDWAAIERACRREIAATRDRDRQAVSELLATFDRYFAMIRPRVGPMLDDLSDYGSTAKTLWFAARDRIDSQRRVERHVRQFLAAYLYLPAGLNRSFANFERALSHQIRAHDQELALALKVELEPVADYLDLENGRAVWTLRDELERDVARDTRNAAVARGLVEASAEAGSLALDPERFVLEGLKRMGRPMLRRLMPRLAAAFGVRAGARAASGTILAGGAALSWWTIGVSLLASILVSLLIDFFMDRRVRSRVERQLIQGLDTMRWEIRQALEREAHRLVDELHDRRLEQLREALDQARTSGKEMN